MGIKRYLFLYYFAFILTLLFCGYVCYQTLIFINMDGVCFGDLISEMGKDILGIINLILVIIFTILLLKNKKIQIRSILLPCIYVVFLAIMAFFCVLFNDKVMLFNIHLEYYLFFIDMGYLFFNIYSILLV